MSTVYRRQKPSTGSYDSVVGKSTANRSLVAEVFADRQTRLACVLLACMMGYVVIYATSLRPAAAAKIAQDKKLKDRPAVIRIYTEDQYWARRRFWEDYESFKRGY